jgi:YVTN family beta-propeller protein
VEIDSRRVLASIEVGAQPDALALTPDGRYLLALCSQSNDLAVVDTARQSLFTVVPLGRSPRGIAVKTFEAAAGEVEHQER